VSLSSTDADVVPMLALYRYSMSELDIDVTASADSADYSPNLY
jgi:hypothetical protein